MESVRDVLFIVALVIIAIISWLFVPVWMMRRSIPSVVKLFKKSNALNSENAKSLDELGLGKKALWKRMWGRRDYKPRAVEFLIQMNVIQMREDGRVFLQEQNLNHIKWRF